MENLVVVGCKVRGRRAVLQRLLQVVALSVVFSGGPVRSAEVVLSEFLAANSSGEKDEDGDSSDWIEIYNSSASAISLAGWSLTDSASELTKWPFPPLTLQAQEYLIVFASGKDRRDPTRRLHTNFRLQREGQYLALVRPDGHTIATAFAPAYPAQRADVSYGWAMQTETNRLIAAGGPARLHIPPDDRLGTRWRDPAFDDSSWGETAQGVGYDRLNGAADPSEPVQATEDITRPSDPIVATSPNSPSAEGVANAIDNNPLTKYLNFDKLNAGLTVIPSAGASVVNGLRLTSANDAPERDPSSYLLLGSNDGQKFDPIAQGVVPGFSARFTPVSVTFTNTAAYLQYRLLFPTVSNAAGAVAVQIAEVELLGQAGSSPANYTELLRTDLDDWLYGRLTSVYLRLPFAGQPLTTGERLTLKMRYDDGFVAWLNGTEVARANAPDALLYRSLALTNRYRTPAITEASFDLTAFAPSLRAGTNVLAIQGLRLRANSPSCLWEAQLEKTRVTGVSEAYFATPTPGQPNGTGAPGIVAEPALNPGRGLFDAPISVAIFSPTEHTTLRYTTNGTAPTATQGMLYEGPLRVDRTTTLRVAAFRDGWLPSRTVTHTFLFPDDVLGQTRASALAAGYPANWGTRAADYGLDTNVVSATGKDKFGGKYTRLFKSALQSLPSVSFVMDPDDLFGLEGIYVRSTTRGSLWERAVSVEVLSADGQTPFQQDAGLRLQGGAFRSFDLTDKKSFRLIARDQYGADRLTFPWFGTNAASDFRNIVLRANSNDGWPYGGSSALYVRDTFAHDTLRAMGGTAPHASFVHLYINGMYWGLYNPVERPDAAFSATYYGGERADWDAINQDSVPDGNGDAWNRLLAALELDLSKTENYQRIQGNNPDGTRNPAYERLIDVDSLIDYMILNIYIGNGDWPGRNWWTGRDRVRQNGFYFYTWDAETALGFTGVDANVTAVATAVARPYAALRKNADFRLRFADHVYRHFSHGGALYVNPAAAKWDPGHPESNQPAARFENLATRIELGIIGESARWGDQRNPGSPYTRDEHWQRARQNLLSGFFPVRSAKVVEQLRGAALYPRTDPPVLSQRGGAVPAGYALTMSAPAGAIYYTTSGADPRPLLAAQDTRELRRYTNAIVLTDGVTLKARVLNGQEWSALEEVEFVVGNPSLRVTELNYHPDSPSAAEQTAGFTDPDDFEFLELANPGAGTFNLEGVHFTRGIGFDFSGSAVTRLAAGASVLVVRNRAAFAARHGEGLSVAGEFTGHLDNSGETVELADATGQVLLSFTYGTQSPWPEAADGAGMSLELLNPTADPTYPANWRASTVTGGTPGVVPTPPPLRVEATLVEPNRLRLRFPRTPGLTCTVYSRDSLTAGDWLLFDRLGAAAGAEPWEVSLPIEPGTTHRFYRVTIP